MLKIRNGRIRVSAYPELTLLREIADLRDSRILDIAVVVFVRYIH